MIVPALKLPDVVHQLALSAHYGLPMLGQWDVAGLVASVVLAVGGVRSARGASRGATSAAEPPRRIRDRRRARPRRRYDRAVDPSSSCWSRARPSSTSRGTSCSRPPAIRCGRRRSGWRPRPGHRPGRARRLAASSAGRPIPTETLVLAVVSGALEALYFAFLAAAYRRGDLSLVYPLARGTAPLLAVAIGVSLSSASGSGRSASSASVRCWSACWPPAAVAIPPGCRSGERGSGGLRAADRGHDRRVLGGRPGRRPRDRAVDLRRPDLGERPGVPVGVRLGLPAARVGAATRRPKRARTASRRRRAAIGGLITLGRLPADPRRVHRRAADRGRAAPRVGDRPRVGLGRVPPPRGGRSGRRRPPDRGRRHSSSSGRSCWRSTEDDAAAETSIPTASAGVCARSIRRAARVGRTRSTSSARPGGST